MFRGSFFFFEFIDLFAQIESQKRRESERHPNDMKLDVIRWSGSTIELNSILRYVDVIHFITILVLLYFEHEQHLFASHYCKTV